MQNPRFSTLPWAATVLGLLSVFSLAAAMAERAPRPNILWITCEDICPNLGCYGDTYACTPQLDRFATQAVRYINAYGITGVCAPNRSCLITGVYPSSLGSHHMRCATRLPESIKCARMVSFVDFAPTVLSLLGVPIPAHMQGHAFLGPQAAQPRRYVYGIRDRMAERYDMVRTVRDQQHQYLRNFMPHVSWSQFVSYTEEMPTMRVWRELAAQGKLNQVQARYFQPTKPQEELYDVAADPHQVRNLAGDPKHQATLALMRAECLAWMKQTHDLGLLPEYELNQRAAPSTPWQMGQDPSQNNMPRLLEAAGAANALDPARLPQLLRLLGADDSAIRWWAVQGLVGLKQDARPAIEALHKALDDASPSVRIAAAEALAQLDQRDKALRALIAGLEHDSAVVRLMAMGVLDRMGPAARPALHAMRKAAIKAKGHVEDYLGRMVQYVPESIGGQP